MKTTKFIGFTLALMMTIWLSPLVSPGKTEGPPDPSSPKANQFYFLPLLMGDYIPPILPTPSPTSNPQSTSTATAVPSSTPIPPSGDSIVADHTVISLFSSIPENVVRNAAAIDTLFMHQSTGNNIDSMGFQCLQGTPNFPDPPEAAECLTYPEYYYDRRNWDWNEWNEPMADARAKTDQWVSVANAQQQDYQVLGMKFCYVDGWNQDFEYYREKMEQLEQDYPQKTFIWSTSVLWSEDALSNGSVSQVSYESIQAFNQQLRAYALANGKILYDLAAIESHDPNGNLCQVNGIEALCNEYYTGFGGGGGGHPDYAGSIRLAKGFWWLMARISGWNGS